MIYFKLADAIVSRAPDDRIFRIETPDRNFFVVVKTLADAMSRCARSTVHEIIIGPQRIFFDIDVSENNIDPDFDRGLNDRTVCDEFGKAIVTYFFSKGHMPAIEYFSSSVPGHKVSIHIIVSNMYVNDAETNKQVCSEILNGVPDHIREFVDTQVWRKNGSLRAPGSAKLSDPSRVKRHYRGHSPQQLISVLPSEQDTLINVSVPVTRRVQHIGHGPATDDLVASGITFDAVLNAIRLKEHELLPQSAHSTSDAFIEGKWHYADRSIVIQIFRRTPTHCLICDRVHGTERRHGDNMWVAITKNGWYLHCYRADHSRSVRIC